MTEFVLVLFHTEEEMSEKKVTEVLEGGVLGVCAPLRNGETAQRAALCAAQENGVRVEEDLQSESFLIEDETGDVFFVFISTLIGVGEIIKKIQLKTRIVFSCILEKEKVEDIRSLPLHFSFEGESDVIDNEFEEEKR